MAGEPPWDLVIIGAGMAGLSTAIWARRLGLSTLALEGQSEVGGQLHSIQLPIEDYPGVESCQGGSLAVRLRRQAESKGAVIRPGLPALRVETGALACSTNDSRVEGRSLVIATGLSPRRLTAPGSAALYEQGLIRRPSQELDWFCGKRVAVVGGGDRALENALLLATVSAQVYVLHRRGALRARASFVDKLHAAAGIELLLDARIEAVELEAGRTTLILQWQERRLTLEVDALCPYLGNLANVDLVRGQVDLTPDGYIRTDRSGQTSVRRVYAVGDVCTLPPYQSLVTAAGQAMVVAKRVALTLSQAPDGISGP